MKKLIVCITFALALSACGVKPGNVKPPEGARDIYPNTYPYPDQSALDADAAQARAAAAKAEMDKENENSVAQ